MLVTSLVSSFWGSDILVTSLVTFLVGRHVGDLFSSSFQLFYFFSSRLFFPTGTFSDHEIFSDKHFFVTTCF